MERINAQSSQANWWSGFLRALPAPLLLSLQPILQLYSINNAERFGIMNGYFFPDQQYAMLYSGITPVNSFRVVLNQYFGGQYDLLPDRHYYSKWGFPFEFIEVTNLSLL